MKKLSLYFALFLFLQMHAVGAVFTVNNQSTQSGNFLNFKSALYQAASGDTILLVASARDYGHIEITKTITVVGVSAGSGLFEKPMTKSVYIQAPNVRMEGLECSYIYCSKLGDGVVLKGNKFKSISFYEPCENITLLENTFNILDIPKGVSNLMMANNALIAEPERSSGIVFSSDKK